MEIVVWSKTSCPYCVAAKDVLNGLNLEYEERVIGEGYTREQFFESLPEAKTVPQIIIGDTYIGGYSELMSYIESTGFNGTGYTL